MCYQHTYEGASVRLDTEQPASMSDAYTHHNRLGLSPARGNFRLSGACPSFYVHRLDAPIGPFDTQKHKRPSGVLGHLR